MRKFLFLFIIFVLCISLLSVTCFAAGAAGSLGESVDIIGGWEFINTAGISSFTGHFSDGTLAEPLYIAIDSKPQGAVRWRHNMYDFGIRQPDHLVYQVGAQLVQYYSSGKAGTDVGRIYISLASGVLENQNVTQQVAPWGFSISFVYDDVTDIRVRPFQSYSPIYDDRVANIKWEDLGYSSAGPSPDTREEELNWYIICDTVAETQELFFVGNSRVVSVMKLSASDTVFQDLSIGVYDKITYYNSETEYGNNFEIGFFYYSNITYGYQAGYQAGYNQAYDDGYRVGYQLGTEDGYTSGYESGVADGDTSGYERGYGEGYGVGIRETGAALDIPDIITSIMQFTPTLFNRIFGFELFGINIAGVLAACLIIPIVIFVIGKVKHFL